MASLIANGERGARAFTLIELLVVMAIIGLLLAIAAPRYFGAVEKSREAALKQNLALMREAIDKYYGDNGKYPEALEDLVTRRYLRRIPLDPTTDSATTWVTVAPEAVDKGQVFDIKSGSDARARDGSAYAEW